MGLKHLIVHCVSREGSFNDSIVKRAKQVAEAQGHEVELYNVFAEGFAPTRGHWDIEAEADPDDHGHGNGHVKEAKTFIDKAKHITFIYPIWWTGMPAIMKGFVDRVFHKGYAYDFDQGGLVRKLKNKSVLVLTTHGMPAAAYQNGMYDALRMTQDKGIFEFCGMEVKGHHFFAGVNATLTADQAAAYLQQVEDAIKAL